MSIDRLTRHRERGSDERAALDALLDSEWTGVLATVVDGEPWAVPMLYVRDGDRVLLHGSSGAGALRHLAAGAPVVLTVFALDSLVLARSTFGHSADYRSATLRGTVEVLDGEEARRALGAFTDALAPGRTAEVPEVTEREQAATVVLGLPIREGSWLLKQRTHGFEEEPGRRPDDDPTWAGVVPVHRVFGEPVPAGGNRPGVEVPASVHRLLGRAEPSGPGGR